MKSRFSACLRYKLYRAAVSPAFYLSALILNLFSAAEFFLSSGFFSGGALHSFFLSAPYVCIALIPSLSLITGGEDDFFPVSTAQRILTGVLSLTIEFSAMFIPAALSAAWCISLFGDVPAGSLLTGSAIIVLYAFSSAAICAAFKELAPSPAESFLLSTATLALMNAVHLLPQSVPFAQNLGFYRHFYSALRGVIDTRDIFFYIITAILFTALAVFIHEKRAGRKFKKTTIFLVCLAFAFAFVDSEKYFFRADTTGSLSISPFTRAVLQSAESGIALTYYRSAKAARVFPAFRAVRDYLFEFAADKNITADVKDADQYAPLLENYGIAPYRFPQNERSQTETAAYSAIVIEYEGKWDAVPLAFSTEGLEYELVRRILRLMTKKERPVNLIAGGSTDFSDGYAPVIPHLNAKGFVVNEIKLEDGGLYERLKAGGNVALVLGSENISEEDAAAIEEYILDGGNVFFAVSPFSVNFEDGFKITKPRQNPLLAVLESYGFGFSDSIIADDECQEITLSGGSGAAEKLKYPFWLSIAPQKNASSGMALFWADAVTPLNENVRELVSASARSRLIESRGDGAESRFETNPFVLNEEMHKKSNETAVYKTAFELDGAIRGFYGGAKRRNARIVLVPEPYFVSAQALSFIADGSGAYGNFHFLTEQLLRLNGEDELAALHEKSFAVRRSAFYKTQTEADFTAARKKTLFHSFVFMPLAIIAAQVCAVFLRQRHIKRLCAAAEVEAAQ
ncbi:MAG: GldG family protein [Treponema sp.]